MSAAVTHEISDDIAIVRFDDGKANAVGNASDFSLIYFMSKGGGGFDFFVASLFREQYDGRVLGVFQSLGYQW